MKLPCFNSQKKSYGKQAECLCDPLDANNLVGEPPPILKPKYAKHNRLATLRLEYVLWPIILTTYMQRIP